MPRFATSISSGAQLKKEIATTKGGNARPPRQPLQPKGKFAMKKENKLGRFLAQLSSEAERGGQPLGTVLGGEEIEAKLPKETSALGAF